MPPFKRGSFSWHAYGHRESAVLALRDCWRKYLALEGKEEEDCPIVGLFTAEAAAELAPAD